jgi:hypothetical protein
MLVSGVSRHVKENPPDERDLKHVFVQVKLALKCVCTSETCSKVCLYK